MADLIGREDALASLASLVGEHQLVTVVGPGGVGKTSLVKALLADRPHLFAELSSVTDDDGLGDLVARRAGLGGLAELVEWLNGSANLLVIDTCEHVVDGAAALATTVIDQVPDTTVIATSRVPLDLTEEVVHVLHTLPVGDEVHDRSPAVELFLERARGAGASATIEDDLVAVARLCARLDGLPLAIELAAARARSMSPAEMLRHLDVGVDVIRRPRFRGEARHRSLRATINWSVRLLDDPSRNLFERLSVFPGWFDAELAHGISDNQSTLDTSDLLADLVAHSLVRAEVGSASRFVMFDSTRAYAEEQLTESGRAEVMRQAYVDAVCERAQMFLSLDENDWGAWSLRALIDLVDDYVCATRIALHDDTPERAFTLMVVLWGVVPHARCAEIAELGTVVLDRWPDPTLPLHSDVVATTATAMREVGRHDEALRLANGALDHLDTGVVAPVIVHRVLALLLLRDEPRRARRHAELALEAAEDAAMHPFAREARLLIAQLDVEDGEVERALATSRRIAAETGPEDLNHMFALLVEGMAQLSSAPDAAIDTLRLARRLSDRAGYIYGVGASLRLLALRELHAGDTRAAASTVLALMSHVDETRNLGEQGTALLIGAAVLRAIDNPAIDDVELAAAAWRHYDLLASDSLGDLAVPDTNSGRSIAPSRALAVCRAALESMMDASADDGGAVASASTDNRAATTAELRRTGDHWTVTFAGRTVTLHHSKGLNDIATLIERACTEVHILDLAGAGVVESSADRVIDATAMSAYRDRIRDLQGEIADADDMADLGRSERAQRELDELVDQLTAASGLGGRSRRTSGTTERARSTVTKRIRLTIKRIVGIHPELGRHLQASISTGVFCSYDPEHQILWRL